MPLMIDLHVREASTSDMPDVTSLMGAATAQLRTVYRPSPNAAARARSATNVRWLIALSGTRTIGALRYTTESDRLHLGVGVLPEFQRQGVARALLDALAAKATALGLPKLSLYAIEQTGNVPIFAKLGFNAIRKEPAKDIESVNGQPLTDVYMERTL